MKKIVCFVFLLAFAATPAWGWYRVKDNSDHIELETMYGATTIREPVLLDLIRSSAFERLKRIRQYGVTWFIRDEYEYTRHEHSLGVFYLTRKYGAPLDEQVAALLHDVSHTAFSHVGDYIYGHIRSEKVMQDEMHEQYIVDSGLMTILQKYGFSHAVTEEAKKSQLCFEQEKPNICADRFEYVLNGALIEGIFSEQDIRDIVQHVHFKNGTWFFDDLTLAKKYARASVQLPQMRWGAAWHAFAYNCMGKALLKAVKIGLISFNEIKFSTDDVLWNKINASTDPDIKLQMQRLKKWQTAFKVVSEDQADTHIIGKFTGQDPWVMTQSGLQRISCLDSDFATYYQTVSSSQKQGYWIQLHP